MLGRYNFFFPEAGQRMSLEVFRDMAGRRRRRLRGLALFFVALAGGWIYLFFSETAVLDTQTANPPALQVTPHGHDHRQIYGAPYSQPEGNPVRVSATPIDPAPDPNALCNDDELPMLSASASAAAQQRRVFAHLPAMQDWAYLSLKRECGAIKTLMPEWFSIEGPSLALNQLPIDSIAGTAVKAFLDDADGRIDVFPTIKISTASEPMQVFEALGAAAARTSLIEKIQVAISELEIAGLCLDLGRTPDAATETLKALLQEMRAAPALADIDICVVLSATDTAWRSEPIVATADWLVIKGFEEPWLGSPPAALAPQAWFRDIAKQALELIGPEKLVFALGSRASDWTSASALPETIGYAQAMHRISMAGAELALSGSAGNSYARFVDDNGELHKIWMLDAVTAHNQLGNLDELGINNVAVWSLGFEDPGIWSLLSGAPNDPFRVPDKLRHVLLPDYVEYVGDGPFLRYLAPPQNGIREVSLDAETHAITSQRFAVTPRPMTIERYGRGKPNQIVLTFDDGPHPEYTKDILDALKATNTPATFFIVGRNAMFSPDLIDRMINEGHEIGSHTFTHANMDKISETRMALEINLMQKMLNGLTGRETMLFREPYKRSNGPLESIAANPMRVVQSSGYIVAGSDITPPDWTDISADEIVDHIVRDLDTRGGNVIVMHDAGNDHTETALATPKIIKTLTARGYEFVTLSELLGVEIADVMPVIDGAEPVFYDLSFAVVGNIPGILSGILLLAISIGFVRSLGMLILAFRRQRHDTPEAPYLPPVTVVVPAYNEAKSIRGTIESILKSDYPTFRLVVIDDGSMDETIDVLLGNYSLNPRVKIVSQLNGGKWNALNRAVRMAETEVVVCLDADIQIERDMLYKLVQHFDDPEIGAVAGKVVVSNRVSALTRLQALEYITAQSVDRRAAEYLNCMMVVPGAVGAWRVQAIKDAGMYSGDTLTEDSDLTVSVLRSGYRIVYEEDAVVHTPAPPTVRALLSQRLRWTLGMLQTGWKHKGAILKGGPLGLVALPELFLFGYLMPFLAPLADLFLLSLAINWVASFWSVTEATTQGVPLYLIAAYLMLPLFDLVNTFAALRFDRRESYAMLLLFPLQRFFYRQLLYFSVIRSLLRAVTGKLIKWTTSHRIGAPVPQMGGSDAP